MNPNNHHHNPANNPLHEVEYYPFIWNSKKNNPKRVKWFSLIVGIIIIGGFILLLILWL